MDHDDTYTQLLALLDQHAVPYRLIDHAPEGRTELVSSFDDTIDYWLHYQFSPDDLTDWPGKVLVLPSDDYPATGPRCARLCANCIRRPGAHLSPGGSHDLSLPTGRVLSARQCIFTSGLLAETLLIRRG